MMAWKYTAVAFIVPFMFILDLSGYALLLQVDGGFLETIWVIAIPFLGVFSFASAASGWLYRKSGWLERGALGLAGLLLVYPEKRTDFVGIILLLAIVVLQRSTAKKPPIVYDAL